MNVSSNISTLDSNFSGYKDVLEQRNKIAEKQNSLKEAGNKLLEVLITKISENNDKQEQILMSNKELLQVISHGLPGGVERGSGSGGDHSTDDKEEIDVTSSKSSDESEYEPFGFQCEGSKDYYVFPDADSHHKDEDLAFELGNLIVWAIQRSLMVPGVDFTKYLHLGVVPFVVDMSYGLKKVMEYLEADMKVLNVNCGRDGKSSKKIYHQFVAVATTKGGTSYFVLVGCRHPMAQDKPPTILVICDRDAPDLSEEDKEIATEFFKVFIGTEGIVDGVGIKFVRINFYNDTDKEVYFSYLKPSEHFFMVPQVKVPMKFRSYYNFCCCLGTVASIFVTNVVDSTVIPLKNKIEDQLQAYKESPPAKRDVNNFMSAMVMHCLESIINCGVFVNVPDGITKKNVMVEVKKKVDGVCARISKTAGNKEDDKTTNDKDDEKNAKRKKPSNPGAGKDKKQAKK